MKTNMPSDYIESAAHSAELAVDQLDRAAQEVHNNLADSAHQAINGAKPVVERWAKDAESLARRGIASASETSRHLRERAAQASDSTVNYIKDEPIKAMLIAAAAGAALVTLIGLFSRSSRRD